jgi:urocanate hydratase
MNGGFGMVIDGSDTSDRRIREMIHWDVNNGIARRAWARNPGARSAAIRAMESEPRMRITIPFDADEALVREALETAGPDAGAV